MSPSIAVTLITWAAIVLLFFGLAAVLREVRLLRGMVTRGDGGFVAAPPDLVLGPRFAGRIVAAVDSGCPLCLTVVERLAGLGADAILLTHEPPATWAELAHGLPVISDGEAWRSVSHLSPPVLMLLDETGRVRRMLLPVRASEVDTALAGWTGRQEGGGTGDAGVGAHSRA
ncbi:hypothetical protein [Amycolatopsis rifamycinica]|uniref:Thioredoxin domain-containing protein n=1 Tax=Amycolatopsis rifamycinica TaxID=287986 RepID=A0A066TY71_9PSEU|nr:hypothetical protein [Amycolatopsis rifamycinica]KDN16923.1 hypothetical protein DV20_38110 [Amycolatopsis rifamycinica]